MRGVAGKLKIKQVFTFEGKSQSNGIVERFNKTIRDILRGLLPQQPSGKVRWEGWVNKLKQALQIYNTRYHSTIGTAPNNVSPDPSSKHYYKHIIDRLKAKKNAGKAFTGVDFKPGDFVRVRAYNDS